MCALNRMYAERVRRVTRPVCTCLYVYGGWRRRPRGVDLVRRQYFIVWVWRWWWVSVQNRKRKVLSNPGRGKCWCSSSSTSSEPKRVTPQQRSKEFPGEQLVMSSHKLFCKACREELNLKRSTIQNQVRTVKHVERKRENGQKGATHCYCLKGSQCEGSCAGGAPPWGTASLPC
jgi:hypothetical protein